MNGKQKIRIAFGCYNETKTNLEQWSNGKTSLLSYGVRHAPVALDFGSCLLSLFDKVFVGNYLFLTICVEVLGFISATFRYKPDESDKNNLKVSIEKEAGNCFSLVLNKKPVALLINDKSDLSKVKNKYTTIWALDKLQLDDYEFLNSVKTIMFYGKEIEELTIANGEKIEHLELSGCLNLKTINGLQNLANLSRLSIRWARSLTNLDNLANLKQLKDLDLSVCYNLQNFDALKTLSKLDKLSLTVCEKLNDLTCIENLTNLQSLKLNGCYLLTNESVRVLENFHNLSYLLLDFCDKITNLNFLKNCLNLKVLSLSFCIHLFDIEVLKKMKKLTYLDISGIENKIILQRLVEFVKKELPDLKAFYY